MNELQRNLTISEIILLAVAALGMVAIIGILSQCYGSPARSDEVRQIYN